MRRPDARFTAEDADRAHAAWGSNCGPGAIAGVLGKTLDEVRPHLCDFERKRYTNPLLMWEILRGLDVPFAVHTRGELRWPPYGLARIQWHGPWTAPGVPARVAYRFTHWVGVAGGDTDEVGIFDVNAMNSGGWISLSDWTGSLVPWLMEDEPRWDGRWSITHAVEIPLIATLQPIPRPR